MQEYSSRALVVEDDRSWQQILSEILSDAGMTVDVADSAEAALACLRAAPHRLAVVDLSLGHEDHRNQDGLRVLDAVRRRDPDCRSLLLTGYATVELAVEALTQYGAFTCLRKETFRRAQFRQAVAQALAEAPEGMQNAELRGRAPGLPTSARTGRVGSGMQNAELGDGGAAALSWVGPAAPPVQVAGGQARAEGALALLVEDDAGWRSLLAELLNEAGYQAHPCRSYGEALGYLRRQHYRLAVVDLSLASSLAPDDNSDGYRLLAATRKAGVPSIVVSGSALPEDAERAYDEYAVIAFLEKRGFERQALRQALAQVETAARAAGSDLEALTAREREVLELLARGLTNKELAEALVISDNTVKRHLKAIFAKLEVNTRAAAAARAVSAGIGQAD